MRIWNIDLHCTAYRIQLSLAQVAGQPRLAGNLVYSRCNKTRVQSRIQGPKIVTLNDVNDLCRTNQPTPVHWFIEFSLRFRTGARRKQEMHQGAVFFLEKTCVPWFHVVSRWMIGHFRSGIWRFVKCDQTSTQIQMVSPLTLDPFAPGSHLGEGISRIFGVGVVKPFWRVLQGIEGKWPTIFVGVSWRKRIEWKMFE